MAEKQTFHIGQKFALNMGEGNIYNDNFEIRGFVDGLIVVVWEKKLYGILTEKLLRVQMKEGDLKEIQ